MHWDPTVFISNVITDISVDPEIDCVVVVYKKNDGQTIGMGNILGVKDMHKTLKMIEDYAKTLRAAIPTLN